MADRRASATWRGDLFEGKGTVSAQSSGLFTAADVTWASRTEESCPVSNALRGNVEI